jgi:hypothetical protein
MSAADLIAEMLASLPEPGPYVNARIVMANTTLAIVPKAQSDLGLNRYGMDLFGMPVMLDNAMPHGAWRVIDHDGRELRRGGYPVFLLDPDASSTPPLTAALTGAPEDAGDAPPASPA